MNSHTILSFFFTTFGFHKFTNDGGMEGYNEHDFVHSRITNGEIYEQIFQLLQIHEEKANPPSWYH